MPTPPVLIPLIAVLALHAADAVRAAEVAVHASRHAGVFHVEARAELDADRLNAWRVLTDYERLPAFVPGMRVSRVLSREGNRVELEQKGEARLLFLTFPLEVRFAVIEYPHERIVARAIAGSFRELTGTYFLGANERGLVLRYEGRIVPDFLAPPLIGTLVLRANVEQQFSALVDEIARREGPAP